MSSAKRNWRERIDTGIYRYHAVACPSSSDRKPGRKCRCSFEIKVPGSEPGKNTSLTVRGTLTEARREKQRRAGIGVVQRPPSARQIRTGMTVQECAGRWIRQSSRASTRSERERDYRLRIHPHFGSSAVAGVSEQDFRRWSSELIEREGKRRSTVKAIRSFSEMLRWARRAGIIEVDPTRNIDFEKRPPRAARTERVLSAEDVVRLFSSASDPADEALLRCAAEAGLRRGELAGLRWGDLGWLPDGQTACLLIQRSIWIGGGEVSINPTKSGKPRVVPITDECLAALLDHRAQIPHTDADDYVWQGRGKRGEPYDRRRFMTPHALSRRVNRLIKNAGLVDGDQSYLTAHRLRATAATLAHLRGVPDAVIQKAMGHSNFKTTLDHYVTINDNDLAVFLTSRAGGRNLG